MAEFGALEQVLAGINCLINNNLTQRLAECMERQCLRFIEVIRRYLDSQPIFDSLGRYFCWFSISRDRP